MKKSKIVLIVALIIAMLGLSACGGADEAADDDWSVIIVDGVGVEGSYVITVGASDFPTHVPLIMVAEALDARVEWNRDTNEVMLPGRNGFIMFTAGTAGYRVAGETIDWLAPAAVIDGELYVPIPFFRAVFGMGQAIWMGGHVYIDTHGFDDMH